MIEPFLVLTAASLAKGGLDEFGGKLYEKRVEKGGEHLIERFIGFWREAAIDPQTGLPRNHDIQRASLASLRGAMGVLLLELAGRIEPKKNWLNQWAASRSGADWLTKEIFPGPKTPQQVWLNTLRDAVNGDAFKTLHDQLRLSDDQVRECFKAGQLCGALGGGLADKLLTWARAHSPADEHPDFESLLRDGWEISSPAPKSPVSKGLAAKGHTPQPPPPEPISVAHAYCYFFREHLKTDPKVFNSFTADNLNAIRTQLDKQGAQARAELRALREAVAQLAAQPPVFSQFEAWLTPQLGELKELLAGFKEQLDALARGQGELKAQQSEILVALVTLATEVRRGNADQMAAQELTHECLTSAHGKLDHLIGGIPIQRFRPPPPPTRELELLHAKHRTVTLLGRDTDLTDLCAWVESAPAISARLLIGGAGTGKTRLGYELLLRVAAALPGWQAGLLGGAELRRLVERTHAPDFTWPAPTLLVVDYAQTLACPLTELLRALTHLHADSRPPLRLLLLERQPGDWFDDLLRQEDGAMPVAVRNLFHPPSPVPLTPLPAGELRRELLRQTLAQVARLHHRAPTALPAPDDADFNRSLARGLFAQPLNLMLAALAAGDGDLLAMLRRERVDLAVTLADRELRRVERFARAPGNAAQQRALRRLAACATMERGFTPEERERAVQEELAALKVTWPDGEGDLAAVLHEALPGAALPVAPVEPDFVGEALVLQAFAGTPEAEWCAAVERCARRDARNTPATLLHAFQNFGQQPAYADRLLAATDALIRAGVADAEPGLLAGIESALPEQTVELRRRAAEVTRLLYERVKAQWKSGREELTPEVARLANNLANRLSELGRRAEALGPAQEAVDLRRALARANPDAFTPDLASSLNNLANRLSELGRRAEALGPAQEAVDLYRALARANPDAFTPDLAMSLNNLANRLSALGRRAEALEPALEAVDLRRALARANPDAFNPDLAMSLGMMGRTLEANEMKAEATASFADGVRVLTPLLQALPEAHAPLMQMLAGDYLRLLQALGKEPDMDLLAPVVAVFERLQPPEDTTAPPDEEGAPPKA